MRQGWRRVLTASGRSYCLAHEIWPLYTLRGHKDSINAVAFLPNERILAFFPNRRSFASSSAAEILWDVEFGLHPNRPPVVRFIWEALSTEGGETLGSAPHRESNPVRRLEFLKLPRGKLLSTSGLYRWDSPLAYSTSELWDVATRDIIKLKIKKEGVRRCTWFKREY